MKLLRLLLVLLLTLAIPFAGSAAVAMPTASPCPMPSGMTHRTVMQPEHDCCQTSVGHDQSGTSSKAKSSSPCKPGQECKICNVTSPTVTTIGVPPLAALPVLALAPDTFVPAHDPSGLWRPPPAL